MWDMLQRISFHSLGRCSLFHCHREDIKYIFHMCPLTQVVWGEMCKKVGIHKCGENIELWIFFIGSLMIDYWSHGGSFLL